MTKTSGIEFFAMANGRYGWRCRASNGRIVAQGEPNGFAYRSGAERAHRDAVKAIIEAKRVRVIERGEE